MLFYCNIDFIIFIYLLVLEILEPMLREPDEQEDLSNKLPPVDYGKVSEFLNSGLKNNALACFFQGPEHSESGLTSPKPSGARPTPNNNEDLLFEDDQVPSYPFIYPFSKSLQDAISKASEATNKSKTVQSENTRTLRNPFSGPAIFSALTSRGFPTAPKAPLPKTLFPKAKPSSTHPKGSGIKSAKDMTLEQHLHFITRHCQSIFEGPSEAISKSIKVVHVLELLDSEKTAKKANHNVNISRQLKLVTRYCYQASIVYCIVDRIIPIIGSF